MSLRVSQGKNLKCLDTSTAQSKEQGSKLIYVCLYPQGLVLYLSTPSLKVVKPLCRVSPPKLNKCIYKMSLTGMITGQSNLI